MAVFLTVILYFSIVGLACILYAKHWEEVNGKLIMSKSRTKAGEALGVGLNFVERRAPVVLRAAASRGYAIAHVLVHRTAAWAVLHVERVLEKTLHTLRHTTESRGDGEASAFLREVAEHKKLLQDSSSKEKNAIYED
jgi:hypothetical protein